MTVRDAANAACCPNCKLLRTDSLRWSVLPCRDCATAVSCAQVVVRRAKVVGWESLQRPPSVRLEVYNSWIAAVPILRIRRMIDIYEDFAPMWVIVLVGRGADLYGRGLLRRQAFTWAQVMGRATRDLEFRLAITSLCELSKDPSHVLAWVSNYPAARGWRMFSPQRKHRPVRYPVAG